MFFFHVQWWWEEISLWGPSKSPDHYRLLSCGLTEKFNSRSSWFSRKTIKRMYLFTCIARSLWLFRKLWKLAVSIHTPIYYGWTYRNCQNLDPETNTVPETKKIPETNKVIPQLCNFTKFLLKKYLLFLFCIIIKISWNQN